MTVQTTRRALLGAGGAGLAGLALAACGGSSKKADAGSSTSAAPGASSAPVGGTAPTLTFYGGGTGSFTDNFNPFSSTFNNGAKGMIYEPLMFFDQLKAGVIEPWLAKKYTLSSDGKTVTFDLQTTATWSDGKPFTADDVVYTFELLQKTPALNTNGLKIASVKATDAHTVVLTMEQAAYTDIWYIAGQTSMVAKHVWSTKADPSTDTDVKPVGTGAFTVATFTPQSYLLNASPTYWDGKAAIAGVRFVNYSGNTAALAGLVAGDVDWASAFIPEVDKQFVSRSADYHANLLPATGTTYLLPNLTKFPTSELPVRQAIQHALDLKTINTEAFSNVNLLPSSAYVITPRDDAYVATAYAGNPTFDVAKATSTLESAGYTKGSDGIYKNGTGRVSITVQVVSGYADYISALQLMQEQLKAAGIELNVQQDALAAFGVARAQGSFDMLIDAVYGGPGPFYAYNSLFNSALSAPVGKTASSNFVRYSNPKVDALLQQLGTTDQSDDPTVKKLCGEIQAIVVPDMPYIGVAQRVDMSEYSTKKAVGYPSKTDEYAFSNVWANPDIGIVARRLKPA
jgi:peptide/nickel transport system substrate-binding protein